jgi:hypothetical protein
MTEVVIAQRFMGPPDSANGGFTCGLVAEPLAPGPVEVTLRQPPPLERPLELSRKGGQAALHDGDVLVAEASRAEAPADDGTTRPAAISFEAAQRAATELDLAAYQSVHPFPGCFTCGPQRQPGDGLRIFPATVAPGDVASPCDPERSLDASDRRVAPTFVWAALDCPSGLVWYYAEGVLEPAVLGRLRTLVHRRPAPGDELVVAAWTIGTEGRKRHSGSVVWDRDGQVLAEARAIWIELDERHQSRFRTATGPGPGA